MYQLNGLKIKYDFDCQKNDIFSGQKGFNNCNDRILIHNQTYKNDSKYSTLNRDLYCKQLRNVPFRSNSSNYILNPNYEKCQPSYLPHSSSYSNINRTHYNTNNNNIDYNLNCNLNSNEGCNNTNKKIIENEKEIKINWRNINYLNQFNFDESKLIYKKNHKKYKNNYYLNKYSSEKSNNNHFNELNLLGKNLERKYKLYNKITKYDDLFSKRNNFDEKRIQKNERKTKIHNKKKNIFNRNNKININYSFSEKSESFNSKYLSYKNSNNKIQRAFTQIIGLNNNEHIFSIYKHDLKSFPLKEKNIYIKEKKNINENNINNRDLLNYLMRENEEIKRINNTYKFCLDNLFYFLNNIMNKFSQINNIDNIKLKNISPCSELLDFSKCLNDKINIDYFSKQLNKLENIINENINKVKEIRNKKNKYKLLTITKENSLFLPERKQIIYFNKIIENINEKGFSFSIKNEDKEDEKKINNLSYNDYNNNNKFDKNDKKGFDK